MQDHKSDSKNAIYLFASSIEEEIQKFKDR